MSQALWLTSGIAAVFLLAFFACFHPFRKLLYAGLRLVLSGVSLVVCNALGVCVGINLVTVLLGALLGIPGIVTLCAIYALV